MGKDSFPEQMSLLLFLWQEQSGPRTVWRASVRQQPGGERRGFSSPDAALRYLRQQIERLYGSDTPPLT